MSLDQIPHLAGFGEAGLNTAFAKLAAEVEDSAKSLSNADAHAESVEQFRLHWLGRKQGRLKAIGDAWLKTAPPEAKRLIGQRFNKLKEEIEQRLEAAGTGGLSPSELAA
jgi:phenylalanyl-tRNA synthetase alpha chain